MLDRKDEAGTSKVPRAVPTFVQEVEESKLSKAKSLCNLVFNESMLPNSRSPCSSVVAKSLAATVLATLTDVSEPWNWGAEFDTLGEEYCDWENTTLEYVPEYDALTDPVPLEVA